MWFTYVANVQLVLFKRIFESIGYDDMAVVERTTTGISFAGMLDESGVDTVECEEQPPAIKVEVAVRVIH